MIPRLDSAHRAHNSHNPHSIRRFVTWTYFDSKRDVFCRGTIDRALFSSVISAELYFVHYRVTTGSVSPPPSMHIRINLVRNPIIRQHNRKHCPRHPQSPPPISPHSRQRRPLHRNIHQIRRAVTNIRHQRQKRHRWQCPPRKCRPKMRPRRQHPHRAHCHQRAVINHPPHFPVFHRVRNQPAKRSALCLSKSIRWCWSLIFHNPPPKFTQPASPASPRDLPTSSTFCYKAKDHTMHGRRQALSFFL